MARTMKAAEFVEPGRIVLDEKPVPDAGPLDALARATTNATALGAFAAGLGDRRIVTTPCPVGKERMRRPMAVVQAGRVDLGPMLTRRLKPDGIERACDLFGQQRAGVLEVAISPSGSRSRRRQAGRASLLPRGSSKQPAGFDSFEAAQRAREQGVPFRTTAAELAGLGFDLQGGRSVTLVH